MVGYISPKQKAIDYLEQKHDENYLTCPQPILFLSWCDIDAALKLALETQSIENLHHTKLLIDAIESGYLKIMKATSNKK